jgi:hypothetical protein
MPWCSMIFIYGRIDITDNIMPSRHFHYQFRHTTPTADFI